MRFTNDFERFSPLSKPDWRFRRVQYLVRHGRRCDRRDDKLISRMRRFLQDWLATEVDRDELLYQAPALYYAMHLHEESLRQPHLTTLLEAMVLAGLDEGKIGNHLNMIPDSVTAYEKIFFDVRQNLDKRGWIFQQVLVPLLAFKARRPAPPGLDGSLLLASYIGGPTYLDQLIGGYDAKSGAIERFDSFWEAHVKRQGAMAAVDLNVDSMKVDSLFQLFCHLQERPSRGNNQHSKLEKHIETFLGLVGKSINVGGPLDPKLAATPLGEFDDLAVELRDDELMQAARGQRPTDADLIKELDTEFSRRRPSTGPESSPA